MNPRRADRKIIVHSGKTSGCALGRAQPETVRSTVSTIGITDVAVQVADVAVEFPDVVIR